MHEEIYVWNRPGGGGVQSNILCFIFRRYNIRREKKYHTVGTMTKSNIKTIERDQMESPYEQIHDHTLSWLGTNT